jgi:3-deoxy-D-manno-octulosonate 8-phosphate phosphatase, YrbI family
MMLLHRAMLCSPMSISHVVIDVDGTLTDGGICYDATGNELKTFCTRDGAGLFAARRAGIALVVLTSRESVAVQRRAADFQVDILQQNVTGKRRWLLDFMEKNCLGREHLAYIGDDLNDYAAMELACFVGCPRDACPEVRAVANYVAPRCGGHGAVRDVLRCLLTLRGQWDDAVRAVYGIDAWRADVAR